MKTKRRPVSDAIDSLRAMRQKTVAELPADASVGEVLRAARVEANVSLRALAALTFLSVSYLADIERGLRPFPLPRLAQFAAVYRLTEERLLFALHKCPTCGRRYT